MKKKTSDFTVGSLTSYQSYLLAIINNFCSKKNLQDIFLRVLNSNAMFIFCAQYRTVLKAELPHLPPNVKVKIFFLHR
jgi:hypothetical protein